MLENFREHLVNKDISPERSEKFFDEVYLSYRNTTGIHVNTFINIEQGPIIEIENKVCPYSDGTYYPIFDKIVLLNFFEYRPIYSANVNIHELVHATGHKKRLNRTSMLNAACKSDPYELLYEEMVAQYGTYIYLEPKTENLLDKKWLFDITVNFPLALAGRSPELFHAALYKIYDEDFEKLENDVKQALDYIDSHILGHYGEKDLSKNGFHFVSELDSCSS